ncbi:ABC1 kinase family protein [Falsibacillus pallidus]|uniref:ABC1 kinase family protein n=1 Tax=Falsibacillus pallidus TaxID=493781 RepID=UPI001FE5FA55|nr:AarF/UbiB family protein [Falsibacillus pallidus]
MKSERKLWRMWKVLSLALSIVIRVYWYRITRKSEKEKDLLWERIGQEFKDTLFELKGVLIKVGQFLSIRADLLPSGFVSQIQDLVDHVPPSEWEEIEKVLESEWDRPIEEMMHSIEPTAIASASIGEVYRGFLPDGTKVAVKVQRPSIEAIVKTDFRSLAIIIWFADHFAPVPKGFINFKKLYQELKEVIERELDFQKEMESVQTFRQRFQEDAGVKIPEVYPSHCTPKVLVMEWLDGERITSIEALNQPSINRDELSERLFRLFLPQWLEPGIFHADPHSGNVLLLKDGTIALLDFGMIGEISRKDAAHFQELLEGILMKNYPKATKALNQLGFLLPDADEEMIVKLLEDALSLDMHQMKEMDLFTAKKEINDLFKTLPVQVPTRFIFLGRSFVTIEGMIHIISPDQDTLSIIKPAFMDWLKKSGTSKWELFYKWMNTQPIFQIVHHASDYLQAPKKMLSLQEAQQYNEFEFRIYENKKKHWVYIGLAGMAGIISGVYLDHYWLTAGAIALDAVCIIGYTAASAGQRKWLKKTKRSKVI